MSEGRDLARVIAAFGDAAQKRFQNPAIRGGPEEQLRRPMEQLVGDLADERRGAAMQTPSNSVRGQATKASPEVGLSQRGRIRVPVQAP